MASRARQGLTGSASRQGSRAAPTPTAARSRPHRSRRIVAAIANEPTTYRVWVRRNDGDLLHGGCTYTANKPPEPGDVIDVHDNDGPGIRRGRVLTVNLDHDAQIVAIEVESATETL